MPILPLNNEHNNTSQSHHHRVPSLATYSHASSSVAEAGVVPIGGNGVVIRGRAKVAPPTIHHPNREAFGILSVDKKKNVHINHIDDSAEASRLAQGPLRYDQGPQQLRAQRGLDATTSAPFARPGFNRSVEYRLDSRGAASAMTPSSISAKVSLFPPAPTFYDSHKSFSTATGTVVHPPQSTARGGSAALPNREQNTRSHIATSEVGGIISTTATPFLGEGVARPGQTRKIEDQNSSRVFETIRPASGWGGSKFNETNNHGHTIGAAQVESSSSNTRGVKYSSKAGVEKDYHAQYRGDGIRSLLPHQDFSQQEGGRGVRRMGGGVSSSSSSDAFLTTSAAFHSGQQTGGPAKHPLLIDKRTFGGPNSNPSYNPHAPTSLW